MCGISISEVKKKVKSAPAEKKDNISLCAVSRCLSVHEDIHLVSPKMWVLFRGVHDTRFYKEQIHMIHNRWTKSGDIGERLISRYQGLREMDD